MTSLRETRRINRALRAFGLHLCSTCQQPCALDEFAANPNCCLRCQTILNRVRVAAEPAYRERLRRNAKLWRLRRACHTAGERQSGRSA